MMTTTVTAAGPDIFTRNMRIIERRWPHLARLIHAASPAVDFELMMTSQGVPTAQYAGRWLASRHRPLEEAIRLADGIDFVEKATIVVAGFGAGYHVGEIAGRMARSGIVVVFEPDVALLRRVFDVIDHTAWLETTNVIIITDPEDRGMLGRDLQKLESILLLGTAFVEPPAHRERLASSYPTFLRNFREHVTSAETTLMTTLMRSYDTIRNLLMNVDTYALGEGIEVLHDRLIGAPAVVVSAGPSLAKTIRALAEPGVRDRCIIIAVQTALRPLLDAGVRPHFITALDYHEISRRFYEELDPREVENITLIADPKVHPYVIRAWTGPIRCCSSRVLDSLLGDLARPMGDLPAGATVAHLALYAAVHLGCTRIALTGQDLGFPDGLYYAPGTAIHRVWGPELNTFNTIAMMEWERIARMRRHLHQATDVDGKSIYTDTQMLTYLRHFETDFARYRTQGIEIFDATEGGVRKQYTEPITLRGFLAEHASTPLAGLPSPSRTRDPGRRRALQSRLHEIRRDVQRVRQLARSARERITAMLDQHDNQAFVNEQIEGVERLRRKVEELPLAFNLVSSLNQLGSYRRLRADRRLQMRSDLSPIERQHAELERDADNLGWIMDSAEYLDQLLHDAERSARGEQVTPRALHDDRMMHNADSSKRTRRFAAIVPVDTEHNALHWSRDLAEMIGAHSVLETTLRRLDESRELDQIILIAPSACPVVDQLDLTSFRKPITVIPTDEALFGGAMEGIRHARAWAPSSWRGGIGGTSVYDELLLPECMLPIMNSREIDHAALVAPDWIFINVTGTGGLDELIARERGQSINNALTFTQAPPGFSACLVHRQTLELLQLRTRGATLGAALGYQPVNPRPDPIAYPVNLQIDADLRHAQVRGTYDSRRQRERFARCGTPLRELLEQPSCAVARALEQVLLQRGDVSPEHVQLDLTSRWSSTGVFHRRPTPITSRDDLAPEHAARLFEQLATYDDVRITFGVTGDPLEHPACIEIVKRAKDAGISSIHVRTALRVDTATLDALLDAGVDVLSVELHATTPKTYATMMGSNDLERVVRNMEYIVARSRRLTPIAGAAGMALPWIVPHIQRCVETYDELEAFYDRWKNVLAAAVIEAPPPFERTESFVPDALRPAVTPTDVAWRHLMSRMTVLSDGSVPANEMDLDGTTSVGSITNTDVNTLWPQVINARFALREARGASDESLRLYRP